MTNQEKIIKQSRQKEIILRNKTLIELVGLLTKTYEIIEKDLQRLANDEGNLRKEQLNSINKRISDDLDVFNKNYDNFVNEKTDKETTLILKRNGDIFVETENKSLFLNTLKNKVALRVAQTIFNDGLVLNERTWRITAEAKLDITKRIQVGILQGASHIRIAREIRKYVVGSGQGMRYKTERLVFTEMALAYKMANEISVEEMRKESNQMWFEKWELSPRHPKVDVCDILATQDLIGEGPGVYKTAPMRHPNCLCFIYPVVREKRTKENYENISTIIPKPEEAKPSEKKLAKVLTNSG